MRSKQVGTMRVVGKRVRHAGFGTGVVTAKRHDIIWVSFPSADKRFRYPDAFTQFLTFEDAAAQADMQTFLHCREEQMLEA